MGSYTIPRRAVCGCIGGTSSATCTGSTLVEGGGTSVEGGGTSDATCTGGTQTLCTLAIHQMLRALAVHRWRVAVHQTLRALAVHTSVEDGDTSASCWCLLPNKMKQLSFRGSIKDLTFTIETLYFS